MPSDDAAEDGVFPVEVRAGFVGDEELRAVGVGLSRVCHREHAAGVVAEGREDDLEAEASFVFVVSVAVAFVVAVAAVGGRKDRLASFPRPRRVSSLDHEPLDIPVEDGVVVLAAGGQREEVLAGQGGGVAAELELEVAERRVQREGLFRVFFVWFFLMET